MHQRTIGNRIAPLRFILYFSGVVLVALIGLATGRGLPFYMIGFDIVTSGFLLSLWHLLREHNPQVIAAHAAANDANRRLLPLISMALAGVVVTLVVLELRGDGKLGGPLIGLMLVTLLFAWLSANIVFALHYAHIYYTHYVGQAVDTQGTAKGLPYHGGCDFPGETPPDYLDFMHFSLVIGMTCQTADITMTSQRIRRIATIHGFAAFLFNMGVVALSINMLASS